ncbi:hypothetical protein ACFP1Z_27655 [Streptomyces gamaensis]|uniref:Uncharacterized protein n=1 Tax=Streptomyces gamaensis TaxID=1763542 RepID=A0ABW0Z726_9ACTN
MPVLRPSVILLGVLALVGSGLAAHAAFAGDPVALTVAQGSGECAVSWQKAGVTFKPLTAGQAPSSYALSDFTGTVTVDLGEKTVGDVQAQFKGGFTLTDAAGHLVQVSDGQAAASSGNVTYMVKTSGDPNGERLPVHTFASPSQFTPEVASTDPPKVTVRASGVPAAFAPEFARALNGTFGPGTAEAGAPFGTCGATVSN